MSNMKYALNYASMASNAVYDCELCCFSLVTSLDIAVKALARATPKRLPASPIILMFLGVTVDGIFPGAVVILNS